MSFFTCFCDLPQKEHFSRSPPSPIRATYGLLPSWPDVVPGPVLTATPADHLHQPVATMPRRYLVPGVNPTPHEGVSFVPDGTSSARRTSVRRAEERACVPVLRVCPLLPVVPSRSGAAGRQGRLLTAGQNVIHQT